MTAILAIDFRYQIVVLSDCRVSWQRGSFDPQDNLQKVYPFGPTGVFGFSGDVRSAKLVFERIKTEASAKPLPRNAQFIADDIAQWARAAYSEMSPADQNYLELMYVASDYGNVSLAAQNVVFANSVMSKMTSPSFEPELQPDAVRLGYAINYPLDNIRLNRDNMLNLGLTPEGERFKIGILIGSFAKNLATFSPGQVGGMFSIGIVSVRGVRWFSYSVGDLELKIEDGKFIQCDHSQGRRVTLKGLWDFDPRQPDAGNLVFKTPSV